VTYRQEMSSQLSTCLQYPIYLFSDDLKEDMVYANKEIHTPRTATKFHLSQCLVVRTGLLGTSYLSQCLVVTTGLSGTSVLPLLPLPVPRTEGRITGHIPLLVPRSNNRITGHLCNTTYPRSEYRNTDTTYLAQCLVVTTGLLGTSVLPLTYLSQ
jgi:hypothetical protein